LSVKYAFAIHIHSESAHQALSFDLPLVKIALTELAENSFGWGVPKGTLSFFPVRLGF